MRIRTVILFAVLSLAVSAQEENSRISDSPKYTVSSEDTFSVQDAELTQAGRVSLAMTNPDYPVTPGDIYMLTFISSRGVERFTLFVAADYSVNLFSMGSINGRGKTFLELKEEIATIVLASYPVSSPNLAIQQTGVFSIYISGELKSSGEYYAWGLTRVSRVLSGMTTAYTSFRDVEIIRTDGSIVSCDLFRSQRMGDLLLDPYLLPGDRVQAKRSMMQVNLSGAVYREGAYQLLPGETLSDLVEIYGEGFLDNADTTSIRIIRAIENNNKRGKRLNLSYSDQLDFRMENLDQVHVYVTQDYLPVAFFHGAISLPADLSGTDLSVAQKVSYSFYPGETVADAARSLKDSFSQFSDLENSFLVRGEESISIDLSSYLYSENIPESPLLEANDTIIVPFRQFFVTVSGAVRIPGRFPYVPDRSWWYYVNLAGGIDPLKNSREAFKVYDINDKRVLDTASIPPEAKIEVSTNSFLYYFNNYAPIITTVFSLISTAVIILVNSDDL